MQCKMLLLNFGVILSYKWKTMENTQHVFGLINVYTTNLD